MQEVKSFLLEFRRSCFTKRSFEDPDDHFDETDTRFNYDWNSASLLTFGDVQHDSANVATPNTDDQASIRGVGLLCCNLVFCCCLHQYCHSSRGISIHRCITNKVVRLNISLAEPREDGLQHEGYIEHHGRREASLLRESGDYL